ncbi:MAG: hypothetical protein HYT94_01380 [Parcubacteria group bacterium]|nr:hypothetical protein [Parcubacteria group bacterium]
MKNEKKKVKKVAPEKKGKVTLEKLAVFTVNGFEELKTGQEEIKKELSSVKEDQKDHTRRLVSIERKLTGTLISLDETVHGNEFKKLERRVNLINKKKRHSALRVSFFASVSEFIVLGITFIAQYTRRNIINGQTRYTTFSLLLFYQFFISLYLYEPYTI